MANKLISDLTPEAVTTDAYLVEVQDPDLKITRKATQEVVTEVERNARIAQDNVIELGVGSNADGTYNTPVGTNYLDSTTDVMDALEELDSQLGSSGSAIYCDTVGVGAASLNNAGIAPYVIVAAPSANRSIDVIAVSIFLDNNGTDLECGSQDMVLEYDTGASHFVEWGNSFAESSTDVINKGTWTSNVTMLEAKKVQLTFTGGVNPTAGNTTLRVFITYRIVDLVPF